MGGFSSRAKGVGCILVASLVGGIGFYLSSDAGDKPSSTLDGAGLTMVTERANALQVNQPGSTSQDTLAFQKTVNQDVSRFKVDQNIPELQPEYAAMFREVAQAVAQKRQKSHSEFELKADSVLRAVTSARQASSMTEYLAKNGFIQFDALGRLAVTITLDSIRQVDLQDLADNGFTLIRKHIPSQRVEGVVSPSLIPKLASLSNIRKLTVTQAARVSGQGNAQSEGDVLLSASQARSVYGVSGAGVKICVISDGVLGADAAAQAGELPMSTDATADINLCDVNAQDNFRGSEGTAMLEVIHDLAPDAELAFCSGIGSEIGMMNAIRHFSEASVGCNVILDDLSFLMAPYFQEGDVAQAAKNAVNQGIVYISAAGNAGGFEDTVHYEGEFNPTVTKIIPGALGHIFGVDPRSRRPLPLWSGEIEAGGIAAIALQWGEPFGQSGTDIDLYILNYRADILDLNEANGLIGINGTDHQNGSENPLEFAVIQNLSDQPKKFYVLLQDINGAGGNLPLEMFVTGAKAKMSEQIITPKGGIIGHAGVKEVITVGAINANNPGLSTIAPYVSQGPARFLFSPSGALLPTNHNRRVIKKPDLVAVDGVAVSGAGGFPQTFYGTSAAAPHVAAITALMLESNPNLSPRAVRRILKQTADARGGVNRRNIFGSGLVNAEAAVELAVAAGG